MPTIDRAAANDKLGRQVKLKDQLREQNKKLKAENEKLKALYEQLAESCKEAIDGDITEAEKQIKHLKQKNKELKEELKEEKEWEKQTGREEAIEEYEKVAYEMCESRLHANDPILMAGSAKCLNEENKKLKAENEKLKVKLSNTMMDTGRLAETIWEKDEEIKKLKEEMASSQCWCAEAEHWRDELMKVFKSFEETDDVTPEDIDPEFVGAWISDALKRDQQNYDMKEED